MKGKSKITWNHFACDRHEVVTANGCLSESLLLGPVVVDGLTIVERHDLNAIFDTAISKDAALNGPPARVCLTVSEVRRLLAEYVKEKGQRTEREIRKWDCDLAMERYEAERLVWPLPDVQITLTKLPSDKKFRTGFSHFNFVS